MDPAKLKAVVEWPIPQNVSQLKGFLGLSGYYRRFVARFAQLASPLTDLLRRDAFQWNSKAQETFDTLKTALTTAPVLVMPDFTQSFVLETDASGSGIGAVLSQRNHPIAFYSKKLSPRLQNQSVYARELYAITAAVAKFRHYLLGHHFIIRTDHHSLRYLKEQVIQTPEQEKSLPKLLGYNFDIEFRSGKTNTAADALSRVSCMAISSVEGTFMDFVYEMHRSSPTITLLKDQLTVSPHTMPGYEIRRGDLYWRSRLVIPKDNQQVIDRILYEFHSSPTGGHAGYLRTFHRIARLFFWSNMRKDIRIYVRQCPVCQQAKSSQVHPAGLLQPLPIPVRVWEDIAMDFLVGLPMVRGLSVIMVVIDRLSKYGHFIALPGTFSSKIVADAFLQHIVKLHGIPRTIVSDRDKTFTSNFWRHLMKMQGTRLCFSTAYHPHSDGQSEALNRCLEMYL